MVQPVDKPNNKIRLKSPGKINLHLAVGGKRPDGFHELWSIFTALDFADTLNMSLLPGNDGQTAITIREEGPFLELVQKGQVFPPIPAEKNTIFLASQLFRKKTGFKANLSVELIKRIPPGSGLGGGSSNAAAALLGMNELGRGFGIQLSGEEMLDTASCVGSDVPFFVEIALPSAKKSPARFVSGRGEIVDYLPPPPPLGVLLAFPGFSSHTGASYALLDEKRPVPPTTAGGLASGMGFTWDAPENWRFYNDFEKLLLGYGKGQEQSAFKTMQEDITKAGAAFFGLSGSGSAFFGVFSTPKEAEEAKKRLSGVFYVPKSTFFLRDN